MPVIHASNAPQFKLEGTVITGLASPSRGSSQLSSWKVRLEPGVVVPAHILTHEEVFVVLAGQAVAGVDGEQCPIGPGDALAVPPGVPFSLAVSGDVPFEAVTSMLVGGKATMVDGDGVPFPPPWSL
jgi:mannose-6-phosphate isomerase-like protein (cupin superfamily)